VELELDIPQLPRLGRLAGRTAVVTGAGSAGSMAGTGAAMAILFASEGADVLVLDVDGDRAAYTTEHITASGGAAEACVADITDPDQCRAAVARAQERFGTVDVLVNNAAIAPGEQDADLALWHKVIDIDLNGAKYMFDAVLPGMRELGRGSVVMISSIAGVRAGGGDAYSAAKAGMNGLARSLALHHGREGIRVNVVSPGHVAIPMGLGYGGWDGSGVNMRAMRAHASLLGTEGTGWDVARAALFLAGDESAYITAQVLPVDGGAGEVMPIVMHDHLSTAARQP
jgi:NAD(P)-dependent dehydrogenase (short-subunit alcohol dehydrogenase family)